MKKLVLFLTVCVSFVLANSIEWRLDRFNESGKIVTIDGKYTITKRDPLAGTLHVDYSDKNDLISNRLKGVLSKMDKQTRDEYLKTIPNGGYLTLFIPRPEIRQNETRWFIYEVFDEADNSIARARSSAVLTEKDSIKENKSAWIAVQTIPLPQAISSKMVVEVTGESCGETQYFTITKRSAK